MLPTLVTTWLTLTTPIVLWDAGFVLNRPHSLNTSFWEPYKLYVTIDKAYGDAEYAFVEAQAYLNLLEVAIGVVALYFHFRKSSSAIPWAITANAMTLNKTILYFVIEAVGKFHYVKHNSWYDYILLYVLTNGWWILMPLLCLLSLWGASVRAMKVDAAKKRK
ncbi:hypothetical protein HDV05_006276 [Chytridiales sp. JEL 0842]|nr:hypothetical protein HDV05_006276 [Chytridiales sp. JEL 0842]